MTRFTPTELAARIGAGLLSFPVTHFRADDLSFDEPGYRDHLVRLGGHDVAGLFAAGGTGEFFSLTLAEVGAVVAAAVASAPEGVPVLAPSGYGTATAVELARAAHAAGADGLLLFPPYLTEADQEGLAAHVRAVCAATPLGVVVYSRGNAVYAPATVAALAADCPTLVGFKDGVGDLEAIVRLHSAVGDRLTYVGGLPTAETFALPYLELGVTTYSSAIFNVLPEFALAFHAAVLRRDRPVVHDLLDRVVLPWTAIRDRRRGYAVSIVKAGMDVVGRSAGPVRPPLVGLTEPERAELAEVVARARDLMAVAA